MGAERDITHFVAPVCNTGPGGQVVGGAGSKVQASSGRLIFSGHSDSHAGGGICVWYSDDGGLTYNVSASGVFPGNENSIADLGNGTLYMNGRGYVFTWKGHRTSYWSHDSGAHWSPGVEVPEIEEPSSAGCQGSLLAVPRSIKRRGVSNYIPGDTAIPARLFFAEPSGVRADGVRTGKDRISLRVWCSAVQTAARRSLALLPSILAMARGTRPWSISCRQMASRFLCELATHCDELNAIAELLLPCDREMHSNCKLCHFCTQVLVWEGSRGPQGTASPPYGEVSVGTMWSTRLTVDDWCP